MQELKHFVVVSIPADATAAEMETLLNAPCDDYYLKSLWPPLPPVPRGYAFFALRARAKKADE